MLKSFGTLKILYHLKTWTAGQEIAWKTLMSVCVLEIHHFFSYCVEEAFACWGLEKDDVQEMDEFWHYPYWLRIYNS